MKQSYNIAESKMDWFKEYVTKINKRAVKLGQKEITYEVVGEEIATFTTKEQDLNGRVIEKLVATKVYSVEVDAEPIKLDGYRFVASIDHGYENGNIVHKVDDVEIPQYYHTVDSKCDHCKTNRRRKITVLLQGESGNLLQIGRSCLKDFLGYDVESKLKYSDLLGEFEEGMEEGLGGGYFGEGFVSYVDIAHYLTFVEQEINENGWASKSSVRDVQDSTAYKAEIRMSAYDSKNNGEPIQPSEHVLNALEWIRTTDDVNRDYMMNLQIMCKNEYARRKDVGYIASLLVAYKNHLDYLRKQELKNKAKDGSKHVGIVGKREVFTLTLERYTSYSTDFGTMWIYIFRDQDGNCFIWKSSKCIDTNEGETVRLKGTIKEHSEFNGEKQTVITRCAEVK